MEIFALFTPWLSDDDQEHCALYRRETEDALSLAERIEIWTYAGDGKPLRRHRLFWGERRLSRQGRRWS